MDPDRVKIANDQKGCNHRLILELAKFVLSAVPASALLAQCFCTTPLHFLKQALNPSQQRQLLTGLFRIVQNGKYGLINHTGKIVIEPQFDLDWNFVAGLAQIKVADKYGYIDKTGKSATISVILCFLQQIDSGYSWLQTTS